MTADCAVLCEALRKLIWVLPPLPPAPTPAPARPVGPKSIPLLRIQEPVIVEHRGSQPINSTTGSKIVNRVDRSSCREPLAFERNTIPVPLSRSTYLVTEVYVSIG